MENTSKNSKFELLKQKAEKVLSKEQQKKLKGGIIGTDDLRIGFIGTDDVRQGFIGIDDVRSAFIGIEDVRIGVKP